MTMLNLSPAKSKGIDSHIYNNAKQLRRDAYLLAEQNASYSVATSLLILSSEEAVKAILVLLHTNNFRVYLIENAKKFFTDHKMRHNLAKFLEISAGLLESLLKYDTRKPVKLVKTNSETFNTILNGLFDLANAAKPFIESTRRIDALDRFNAIKNMGFYVDYHDRLLVPSQVVSREEYFKTKEIVERIFKIYQSFRILFHPCLENHIAKKQIDQMTSMLHELINNGFEGYKFNEL